MFNMNTFWDILELRDSLQSFLHFFNFNLNRRGRGVCTPTDVIAFEMHFDKTQILFASIHLFM